MINGHLSEARQGFALIEDVDQDTFVRFIRWTYTGGCSAPEYTWAEIKGGKEVSNMEAARKETSVPDDLDGSESSVPDDGWCPSIEWRSYRPVDAKIIKKNKSSSRVHTTLKESFVSAYDSSNPESKSGNRGNLLPQEDYTEVFLEHARLYVFAEKYDI